MAHTDTTARPPRLLELLGVDGMTDPATLRRAMVRLAHLAAAEHRAQAGAALAKPPATDEAAQAPADGPAGRCVIRPLDRAVAIDPRPAVVREDDR